MLEVREYLDGRTRSPFGMWFNRLDTQSALKVNTYITRLSTGNFSRSKTVGGGVQECQIDWGPGYRIYFGMDGAKIIILLGGGTKKQQQRDIVKAKKAWKEYKKRKGNT